MRMRHQPVMVAEVVEAMRDIPAGVVVDATIGSGGHAEALLAAHSRISVLGFDRDEDAVVRAEQNLTAAEERFDGARFELCLSAATFSPRSLIGVD